MTAILAGQSACTSASTSASVVRMSSTLYVRNLPADVAAELRARAERGSSSKNHEAIAALRRGLGLDQFDRTSALTELRHRRPSVDADIAAVIRAERPE